MTERVREFLSLPDQTFPERKHMQPENWPRKPVLSVEFLIASAAANDAELCRTQLDRHCFRCMASWLKETNKKNVQKLGLNTFGAV